MRKLAAIVLISVYLFGATDASQLLKLPMLVQHYFTHQQDNPGLTLSHFLALHYQDKLVVDDDFQQDMQLPFKALQQDPCLSVVMIIPMPIEVAYSIPDVYTPAHVIFNDDKPTSAMPHTIFQPPRV